MRGAALALALVACDPRVCEPIPQDQIDHVLAYWPSDCAREAIARTCLRTVEDLGYAGMSWDDGTSYVDTTAPRGTISHELAVQVMFACEPWATQEQIYERFCGAQFEAVWCR